MYSSFIVATPERSSLYTSFVGWISGRASTEYDRDRLVYKLDECRTRCYVLVDALALIHPTWLSKVLIGHTGQVATSPYGVLKQQSLDKGSAAKVMYNDERRSVGTIIYARTTGILSE